MASQPLGQSVVPQSVQQARAMTRTGIFTGGDDMLAQFLRYGIDREGIGAASSAHPEK